MSTAPLPRQGGEGLREAVGGGRRYRTARGAIARTVTLQRCWNGHELPTPPRGGGGWRPQGAYAIGEWE